ncbi:MULTISPECIES: hypothetical protein [Candidatus Ichthyocystis]|uniref:hypothetical protein n=1 Tax=Candidatus Ichthyocystis TaxID=2929841 RepID=UPI000B86431C|nr:MULTISPECIES: hypothetical protein [Ichthyocystis]
MALRCNRVSVIASYFLLVSRLTKSHWTDLTEFTRHREYLYIVNNGGSSAVNDYEIFLGRLTDHKNDQCDRKVVKLSRL